MHKLKKTLIRIYEDVFHPELQFVSTKKREKLLKDFYKEKTGKDLDLKKPVLFTEKLQWMKLYFNQPEMKQCVDKYLFKKYIEDKIGGGILLKSLMFGSHPTMCASIKFPMKSLY